MPIPKKAEADQQPRDVVFVTSYSYDTAVDSREVPPYFDLPPPSLSSGEVQNLPRNYPASPNRSPTRRQMEKWWWYGAGF